MMEPSTLRTRKLLILERLKHRTRLLELRFQLVGASLECSAGHCVTLAPQLVFQPPNPRPERTRLDEISQRGDAVLKLHLKV